jgi:hypothetical protein
MTFAGRLIRFLVELNKHTDEVRRRAEEADGDPIVEVSTMKNPFLNWVVHPVCQDCFNKNNLSDLRVEVWTMDTDVCDLECRLCRTRTTNPVFIAMRDVA